MAKIKFGMMMTDARGKLGGQVFSKNRSGSYVRTKVTPVNPQTSFQQANRSLLGNLSSNWSQLTSAQRASWNSVVESWQTTNVFGDLSKPTGKNLFTGLNKNRTAHYPALAFQRTPPDKTEFPAFAVISGSISAVTGDASVFIPTSVGVEQDFRIRATPSLSAGTSYVKNKLRTLGTVFNATEAGQMFFSADYASRFGLALSGSVVAVELTPISETGQLGTPAIILLNIA